MILFINIWLDPSGNIVQNHNTTNFDPKNHSSNLISHSDILLSFLGKSSKQILTNSPTYKVNNNYSEFKDCPEPGESNGNGDSSERKNKKFLFNITKSGIEEEKKEDDLNDEKEKRLNKQKAYQDAIRKDIQRIKMQKLAQNQNEAKNNIISIV